MYADGGLLGKASTVFVSSQVCNQFCMKLHTGHNSATCEKLSQPLYPAGGKDVPRTIPSKPLIVPLKLMASSICI